MGGWLDEMLGRPRGWSDPSWAKRHQEEYREAKRKADEAKRAYFKWKREAGTDGG